MESIKFGDCCRGGKIHVVITVTLVFGDKCHDRGKDSMLWKFRKHVIVTSRSWEENQGSFLEGVVWGLSVEGQDVAWGHGGKGLPGRRHCGSGGTGAGKHTWAPASGLHARRAGGDGMGRVSWEQMIEKELGICKGCSGNVHRKGKTRVGHQRLLKREEEVQSNWVWEFERGSGM